MRRLALVVFSVTFVGCAPPPPGVPTTFDDFCDAKYDPPDPNAGSDALIRVSLEGYLAPPALFSMCSDTCSFDLHEKPNADGRSVFYSVKLGTGKNQLEPLPERFEASDFKLRTQNEEILGFGDRVRLHGRRLGTAATNDCQLYGVDLIEKP